MHRLVLIAMALVDHHHLRERQVDKATVALLNHLDKKVKKRKKMKIQIRKKFTVNLNDTLACVYF